MVLFVKKCVNIQYRKIISMTILNEHVQYEDPKAKIFKKINFRFPSIFKSMKKINVCQNTVICYTQ